MKLYLAWEKRSNLWFNKANMKLYLAWYSTGKKAYPLLPSATLAQCNFLQTYLAVKNKWLAHDYKLFNKKFFLDSWAFSAATQWTSISIDDYEKFIKENKQYLELYANLDVIWDWDSTLKNQEELERRGLSPLPTYHLWSDKKFFEHYVHNYDYIGLWWMVPYANKPKKIKQFLDYCFWYINKHNLKTKCHWRGMTNPKLMAKYPFYSIDSTWWLAWWKFNRLYRFQSPYLTGYWAKEYRDKYGIDFWVKHYSEKNNSNIIELYKYMTYLSALHKAKKMDYFNH